jgi:hypothetical protein
VDGDDLARTNAFRRAFNILEHRIKVFASLPPASLDRAKLQEIGQSTPGA